MINRINLILRAKNITARQFAEEIGIQPSGMSHILGGRNNPSLDFVSKVLRRYPEIDANWLIMGKGEMYSSPQSSVLQTSIPSLSEDGLALEHPLEPSLFEEEPSEPLTVSPPSRPPLYQQGDVLEEEVPYTPVSRGSAPKETSSLGCKVERILLIYSDKTYQELRPQE